MPIIKVPGNNHHPRHHNSNDRIITSTAPEWKLFQSLKKQGGGISVLLIFTFALLIYSLYHYSKSKTYDYCIYYEVWLIIYIIVLLLFRIIHHISVNEWQNAIQKRNDTKIKRYVYMFINCHKILIPCIVLLIVAGFILLSINNGSTKDEVEKCLPIHVILLTEFLLVFAVAVTCLKIGLVYGMYISSDLSYMTRLVSERIELTPQFLSDENGTMDSQIVILSSPIVKAYEIIPNGIECTICLEAIEKEHPIRNFPCKHYFHLSCIDKWLKDHSTCPLCVATVRQASDNINLRGFYSRDGME